jgi:hypothetical protein
MARKVQYKYMPCDWTKCYYCEEPATLEEHVLPESFTRLLPAYNFPVELLVVVPGCLSCNSTASNKLFDSLESKANYIRRRRYERATKAYDYELASRLEMMLASFALAKF